MKPCHFRILVADDDPDDRMLVKDALSETQSPAELQMVVDGEDLLDCLHRRGKYQASGASHLPDLILLDLNMPRKDGREALREIKSDPVLRRIPIIVLTTSKSEDDIERTYDLGVNAFISKPSSFQLLVETMATLTKYWFETVKLPSQEVFAL